MTTSIYHYVYRITNTIENKHYYGSRTCKGTTPKEDLGIKYFSCSFDKAFMNEQKEHPNNFKYKIVRKFTTRKNANDFEEFIHLKLDVRNNIKFYNRTNAKNGFNASGFVPVRDTDGNTYHVPVDDPRYLSGELIHNTKNRIVVRNDKGIISQVASDDSRYLSGELVSIHKGMTKVIDEHGNRITISIDNEDYKKGKYKHIHKGKVTAVDHFGNKFKVNKDDIRLTTGELRNAQLGVTVHTDVTKEICRQNMKTIVWVKKIDLSECKAIRTYELDIFLKNNSDWIKGRFYKKVECDVCGRVISANNMHSHKRMHK